MAEKRASYPSFKGKKVTHKFLFTLWSLETQCKGGSWCWLNRSSSIQLWLFSGWVWKCCWQALETGLLAKSTMSKGPGLTGTDLRKKLRKGCFHEEKTDFWTRDGWPYCLHRSTVRCSLMRKAQWKARGQQSCRAQHAKEIQDARDLQKPLLVRSKVPAEQLAKLCREEFQKIHNGRFTLFPGISSNTRAPSVLNDHFSTKCTRKSLTITLQWEPLASISHCPKHHSSARRCLLHRFTFSSLSFPWREERK